MEIAIIILLILLIVAIIMIINRNDEIKYLKDEYSELREDYDYRVKHMKEMIEQRDARINAQNRIIFKNTNWSTNEENKHH